VHFTPARATLRQAALEGFDPPAPADDDARAVRLTVAAGPAGGVGEVSLGVPDGLAVTVDGTPARDGTVLTYQLADGEHAAWTVTVRALPQAPDGRYFLAARITDDLGQVIEETALVTLGEPVPPSADLDPMEAFFLVPGETMAQAGETDLTVTTPSLALAPGATGTVEVRVASHLASELRGEAQLLSPFGAWDAVPGWVAPVRAGAGATATLSFPVTVPATARPGWESWLLVKLMYFGRVRYSETIRLTVTP
jgi:hypothetical protein